MDKSRERKILSLLNDDPTLILLLKSKCITDNMWKLAIEKEPELFRYHKNPSKELCKIAITEDGRNLKWVLDHPEIEVTDEMIWDAIHSYPGAIFLIPSEWRTDAFKEEAFDLDPSLMREFPRIRSSYLRKKIDENPAVLQYIKYPPEDLVCRALLKNPNVVVYVRNFTPRIQQLIKAYYPYLINSIPALKEVVGGSVDAQNGAEAGQESRQNEDPVQRTDSEFSSKIYPL